MKGLILTAAALPSFAPLHETIPLEGMSFLGRPLLAWHLEWFAAMGVQEVMLVLHHLPQVIVSMLPDCTPRGLSVRTCLVRSERDMCERLRACSSFLTETTLIVSSQRLHSLDLAPAIRHHLASRPMLTAIVPDQSEHATPGIFLAEPQLLEALPPSLESSDWSSALREASMTLPTLTAFGSSYELACPKAFALASQTLCPPGIELAKSAHVHPSAQLRAPVSIGPDCHVERDAQVGPGVVLNQGVRLERGAQVEGCVVLEGVRLGMGRKWRDRLLASHGSFDLQSPNATFEPCLDPEELGAVRRAGTMDRWLQLGDSLLAWMALVLLSPLLLLISLLIVLDNPGPIFYTQLRVGQDRRACRLGGFRGRIFELYKFRTMRVGAEMEREALRAHNHYGHGAFFKLDVDPRVTRLGAWLRRTSLDELPQLLNVARADMRLVGNRPLPLYEAEALSEPWQRIRFASPAGITGLWQISGRSDLSERERMVLDATYSVTRTVWKDLGILAKTIPALLLRRGAR